MENNDMRLVLDEIKALREEMNDKFVGVDKKFGDKFDGLDKKIEDKFNGLDKKLDDFRDGVDRQFVLVHDKFEGVDRQFGLVHNELSQIKENLSNLTTESRSHHKHTDEKLDTLEYAAQKMSYQPEKRI
ncbi:hypothetical protein [Virgibacillus sp. CBA3643]|uniref:hypothetical protein n=1 Tax=Virgibacillus sp. CBA3643 TaxID=2942278 RepID=UPI0035A3AC6C